MTLLLEFRWITKKIDGVFYELFVFLFWQPITEIFLQGALCQNPLPQGMWGGCVCVIYNRCLWFKCVQFGMSPCGQIAEHRNATSVLIFISLMLKLDTVQCSACLYWWDNTRRRHTPPPPHPHPTEVWEHWYRSDLVGMNEVKNDELGLPRSVFVFDQNEIHHSFITIYLHSLHELWVS